MSADRPRILVVALEWPTVDGRHVGGVGRYVHRFTRELSEVADVTVATVSDPVRIDGVRFIDLGRPAGRLDRFYRIPWRLGRRLDTAGYDIVHAHGDDWALRRTRPIVRTFYGSSLNEARNSRLVRRLNHYVLALLEHRSALRAAVRIGIGGDSMAEFRSTRLMAPVVPVGSAVDARSADPSVVFIGSYEGRKRGRLAEEAVRAASASIGRPIALHVVGPAGDAARWTAPFVEHHAGLDDQAVLDLIARSWVLVSPSAYEGFGIPIFEAAALGTPVVASPNPGSALLARELDGADLRVVPDELLVSTLAAVLREGPRSATELRASVAPSVERLLRDASATSFVAEVCRPLIRPQP
jgi:glycosyltransferase involved in cell wall biosynthesis